MSKERIALPRSKARRRDTEVHEDVRTKRQRTRLAQQRLDLLEQLDQIEAELEELEEEWG